MLSRERVEEARRILVVNRVLFKGDDKERMDTAITMLENVLCPLDY